VLELWRVRAIVAEVSTGVPADGPLLDLASVEREIEALTASPGIEVRAIGAARDGRAIRAIGIAPDGMGDAPTVVVAGGVRGDAPSGAMALLALARRLAGDADLRAELGVRWWLVPCLDPAGLGENAGWWEGPLTLEGYARGVVATPEDSPVDDAAEEPPVQHVLLALIASVRPAMALLLADAPVGGFALFARRGESVAPWRGREGDFFRLLGPLGLPVDLGGVFGAIGDALAPGVYPLAGSDDAAGDPYARFRRALVRPAGALPARLARPGTGIGAIVAPLFADYARRERDRTAAGVARRAVVAEGIRLWREWFAFGRTALDLVAPLLAATGLANSTAHGAVLAALSGADTMLAEGLRWPALVAGANESASVAETFAHGDAVRFARLPRLAALVGLLREASARLAPAPPDFLVETLERALDTQTRWIDELAAPDALRPLPRDRAVVAQLGALLLALP
jgi:hypothetical protein